MDIAQQTHARNSRDSLVHRGPDWGGEWSGNGIYMGHRRLGIIDLSAAGRQPMVSEGVVVTVNGEIYNFRPLRAQLEEAGYRFKSGSDSEVILHGFRHWGIDGLAERIDGMYAAVIYDESSRRVFALTDRAGVKPLYYYHDGRILVWGSELKSIVAYPGLSGLEPDPTSLVDFLVYRYIPAPKTLYRNVFKLPPATVLGFETDTGRLTTTRYWKLPEEQRDAPHAQLCEEMRDLLSRSVSEQLVSDVPLGILLSGGMDSSSIVAMVSRHVNTPLTFSMGFNEETRDETPFALAMARHAGTRHHSCRQDESGMEGLLPRMEQWFDEPFGDTSAIPTFGLCQFARGHVTVALSGDGGDELFGGYLWYEKYENMRCHRGLNPLRLLRHMGRSRWFGREMEPGSPSSDPLWLYARLRGGIGHRRLEQWTTQLGVGTDYDPLWAYRACFDAGLPPRRAARVMDFHTYLPNDILTKLDRVSMAVSLECRPPFLSRALIEFAFALPESFIFLGGRLKGGLRSAMSGVLPERILKRGKQGFGVPDSGWRRDLVRRFGSVQEAIIDHFLKDQSIAKVLHHGAAS